MSRALPPASQRAGPPRPYCAPLELLSLNREKRKKRVKERGKEKAKEREKEQKKERKSERKKDGNGETPRLIT